jgi:hypothetical protein
MASYGFGLNNKGWNESKMGILSKALKELVGDMEGEGKFIGLARGQKPYVQVDEPFWGIAIMNVSYLTKEFQYELVERANKKYLEVMTGTEGDSEGFVISKNN